MLLDSQREFMINRSKISNSYSFRTLRVKTDPYFKNDYEPLFIQASGIADRIAFAIGVDTEKVQFLLTVSFIGKIDGGESTINYVNGLLYASDAITEIDIAKNNLRKIFGTPEDVFSPEELDEMFSVISHSSKTVEGKIVDAAHVLQLVSSYMRWTGQWDDVESVKYTSKTADSIEIEFKETGVIKLDQEIYDFAKTITPINRYDLAELDALVEQNKGDRQRIIEALGCFMYKKRINIADYLEGNEKRLYLNRSRITDSMVFDNLKYKTGPYCRNKELVFLKDNYQKSFFRVSYTAERIARALNVDAESFEKIRFLSTVSFVGKADGGESTIQYINGLLSAPDAITELDIAKCNLKEIFGTLEDVFSPEEIDEMFNVVSHSSKTVEGKIVDAAHVLQLIIAHMFWTGQWKGLDGVNYISKTADSIVKEFKETGIIKLDQKTYDFAKTIAPFYTLYDNTDLDKLIERKKGDRQLIIEALASFMHIFDGRNW